MCTFVKNTEFCSVRLLNGFEDFDTFDTVVSKQKNKTCFAIKMLLSLQLPTICDAARS